MAEVIASILPRSVRHGQRLVSRAAMAGAGWIELRLDEWPRGESLEPLIGATELPILVAIRTPRDAGRFDGSLAERRALFEHAIEAGASAIDLEEWERWSPQAIKPRLLMRSFHDFSGPGDGVDLRAMRDRLLDAGSTWAKIVVTAPDLADAGEVLDLVASSDPQSEPTIGFAMGERAWPSRVLSCLLGAPMAYGAVGGGEQSTAPGQLTVAELCGIYDVRRFGTSTRLFGLLGNPARHSLGPWLHNRAFRRLGLDALYLPFETSRPREVVAMLPRRRLGGLSVTAPFKSTLVPHCHELAESAIATGVVNTLTFPAHGQVIGHNTDVLGVQIALLDAGLPNRSNVEQGGSGPVGAILGTGGAARAAAIALQQLGYSVTFLGRSLDSVREFARERSMGLARLDAGVLRDLRPVVVVQATPVGTAGRDDPPLLEDWQPERGVFVLDMVYRPLRTEFLARTRSAGGTAVSGIGMFLTQAAEQLELFTGRRVPEDELERFLSGLPARAAGA